jgi:8-oxo-dGTP pyrophosphatase MutT (NUDIX family)
MRFRRWLEDDRLHSQALNDTGFWGRAGAGAVIIARDTGRILLPHRSRSVEQPGTWGVWGGAIDPGEDPELAARREVEEEAGATQVQEMIPLHVFRKGDFRYHNFLAIVPGEFAPRLNWETQGYKWVDYGDWPRPLHFGLESLIRNSGDEIRRRTEPQVQEMALKSYRTDFRHEPKDDEGFGTHQGKPDLGKQVYKGAGSPNSIQTYFSRKDRAVITHPRTLRTLEQRLARSGYDFNILMVETADERGRPPQRRASNYKQGVEEFMRENGIRREGHITFVKNGTSGHVLTPWMILHTLGHAVTDHIENHDLPGRTPMRTLMNMIAAELDPGCKGGVEWLPDDKQGECLGLVGSVFMFKSARLDRFAYASVHAGPDEFLHELVAEYLWNGDEIRISPPHQKNPRIVRRVEEMKEIVRSLLSLCVGEIIYDYT